MNRAIPLAGQVYEDESDDEHGSVRHLVFTDVPISGGDATLRDLHTGSTSWIRQSILHWDADRYRWVVKPEIVAQRRAEWAKRKREKEEEKKKRKEAKIVKN